MTHSGGKPHTNVGDRGQRYQVNCKNMHGDGTETAFGWSETLQGAARMVRAIEMHPSWHSPSVIDRRSFSNERVALEIIYGHLPLD